MDASADLSKFKVADLKKELKARGLSVVGNKNELVERLQEAMLTGGDVSLTEGAGGDDEEEFDEEEILGDVDALDDEDTNLTEQEEEAALGLLEPPSEKKKISLKRSEPVLSSEPESKEEASATETEENGAPKKVVKIVSGDVKTAPETRAERFGTEMSDEARRVARAARFNITAPESNGDSKTAEEKTKPNKLSTETGGTDLTKLKARAERFGEVTSKTLGKLEVLEKKKARMDRFNDGSAATPTESSNGTPAKSDADADAKKAERAAKFGLITAPGSDQDEAKKKRAERFGV